MLSVTQLSAHYLEKNIFQNITFQLKPGECMHVIGPNGAGKSTLLKIVASLKTAQEGEVRYDAQYQAIYVGHQLGLMDELTVAQNVGFYDELFDNEIDLATIYRKHDLLGLEEERVRNLSRGQQQRVALSRLSMSDPTSVWLLDEPLTGLDAAHQTNLFELIDWHVKRKGIVLMTSHTHRLPIEHRRLELAA